MKQGDLVQEIWVPQLTLCCKQISKQVAFFSRQFYIHLYNTDQSCENVHMDGETLKSLAGRIILVG